MSTNIKTWYDFVLQQMAAESYLDQIGTNNNNATRVLMYGSNNPTYQQQQGNEPTTTSGFSATTSLVPTLSIRSTEYFNQSRVGCATRCAREKSFNFNTMCNASTRMAHATPCQN